MTSYQRCFDAGSQSVLPFSLVCIKRAMPLGVDILRSHAKASRASSN